MRSDALKEMLDDKEKEKEVVPVAVVPRLPRIRDPIPDVEWWDELVLRQVPEDVRLSLSLFLSLFLSVIPLIWRAFL
jgi:hypothetical protein